MVQEVLSAVVVASWAKCSAHCSAVGSGGGTWDSEETRRRLPTFVLDLAMIRKVVGLEDTSVRGFAAVLRNWRGSNRNIVYGKRKDTRCYTRTRKLDVK